MEIKMDDREKNEKIEIELNKIGIDCIKERLKIGDYIHKDICIEMKSIDDFCGSICDGRLERQVENMELNYEHNFLLVHGLISKRYSKININCVLGMYLKFVMDERIEVVWVENEKQIAFVMKRIFERYNLEEMKGGEKVKCQEKQ